MSSVCMGTDVLLTITLTDHNEVSEPAVHLCSTGLRMLSYADTLITSGCILHGFVNVLKKTTHSFVLHIFVEGPHHGTHSSRCKVCRQEQDKESALVEGRDNKQTEMSF